MKLDLLKKNTLQEVRSLKMKWHNDKNSRTGRNLCNIALETKGNVSIPGIRQTSAPDQERVCSDTSKLLSVSFFSEQSSA